jgi:hypothetical protein
LPDASPERLRGSKTRKLNPARSGATNAPLQILARRITMTNSHLDPRSVAAPGIPVTYHRTSAIDGLNIFYREAGPAGAPVVLLLHGFPTSSHMFRNLIPALADRYHVIAPAASPA